MLPICAALLALMGTAVAQPPPEPGPLSLADAMRLALQLRPSITAAQAGVEAAQAAMARVRARNLPTAEAYWDWSTRQSLARTISIGGGTIQSGGGRSDSRDLGLSLAVTLYDSTTRPSLAQARASAQAAEYRLEDARRELALNVARLYLTALGQEQLAEVAASALLSAQRQLEMVEATIAAGTAAAADRFPVQAQLARARLNATAAESALSQVLADLRATLGLPPGPPLQLSDRLAQVQVPGETADLVAQALQTRPDVLAQRAAVEASRWSLRVAQAQAGLAYSVTAQGDYGRHNDNTGEAWSVGAGVSYPLFDPGARAEVRAAEANYLAAQAQLAELELSVRREVEQQHLALAEAAERIVAAQAAEESARASLEAAEARYAAQVAIILEVTNADQALREAQASRVQALYDYNLAQITLMSAIGVDLLQALGASQ